MAFYLEIAPVQEPFDLGVDEAGRARVVFNINVVKTQSATFEEELVKILENAGLGTFGVNIFSSTHAVIPAGVGPFLSIIVTGGAAPLRTQNSIAPAYRRPSAQIVVRASTYLAARAMAIAAYDALAVVRNMTVTP